jgi:glucose-1-phosphate thymidylyltransferase
VFLKKVEDPRPFGVPRFDDKGRILRIEEKPAIPPSSYSVIGLYLYDAGVFDIVRRIAPSRRGELEITDVNNEYARQGKLAYTVLNGWWIDAGTHESLMEAALKMTAKTSEMPHARGDHQ